jgi:hypothetical protein
MRQKHLEMPKTKKRKICLLDTAGLNKTSIDLNKKQTKKDIKITNRGLQRLVKRQIWKKRYPKKDASRF